ncbi:MULTISPECIES: malonate transporter subunit MadL [unclassified Dietzia]|uniref:malonate transporter subunit MadL n=1 Tax=unclassified Dietzia TaxID=2617939 RepID=UPI000D2283F4|nr:MULTISPECIES: malonate transporter subunit MadL [unclassified Dietzia]AVZ39607.1 malonate transporter subunit MadL [Dietzia sp. JS16-p6b]MBB1024098.1 malonate transporter subunit MadL [Dietzia sp. DQ12-76]MBB1028104.1 malonate transporter subunit MadL [Dietzia sp. DQ11-38-2]QGW24912.1 malonate transporter, MadL subunit [Dietzia sp. DQ12-45-1b]
MVIYGVAILAGCTLAGAAIGQLLGELLGVDANVGGVGFGMLLLIVITDVMRRKGRLPQPSERGVLFWSAMYIPVVVAMASVQNVSAAVSGGAAAVAAGLAAMLVGAALVPVISRIGPPSAPLPPLADPDSAAQEI